MKCFAVIVAAAVAVASAVAQDCDLPKIVPIVRAPDALACTEKSGFSFLTAKTPTADVLAKVCPVEECQKVLKDVAALGLGDCTVMILTPPLKLETDLIGAFQKGCAGLGGAATGGSGSGNASTVTAATPAPVETTTAPAATPSAGSAANASAPNTTAPATSAPTPSPTSAASSVAVASSAVVLVVAASFL